MSAEFLVGRDAGFVARARKLARVLDDRFDAFGDLLEDDALDHAATILEQLEEAGCSITFPPDVPETPTCGVP